jgi:hypothetical protein
MEHLNTVCNADYELFPNHNLGCHALFHFPFSTTPSPSYKNHLFSILSNLFKSWDTAHSLTYDERRCQEAFRIIWNVVLKCYQYEKVVIKVTSKFIQWADNKTGTEGSLSYNYDKIGTEDYQVNLERIWQLTVDRRAGPVLPPIHQLSPDLLD